MPAIICGAAGKLFPLVKKLFRSYYSNCSIGDYHQKMMQFFKGKGKCMMKLIGLDSPQCSVVYLLAFRLSTEIPEYRHGWAVLAANTIVIVCSENSSNLTCYLTI